MEDEEDDLSYREWVRCHKTVYMSPGKVAAGLVLQRGSVRERHQRHLLVYRVFYYSSLQKVSIILEDAGFRANVAR